VYSADRSLLKEIITLQPEEPVNQIVSKHVDANAQVAATLDSVDVADVVLDDLDRLSRLKDTFENLFMDYPKSIDKEPSKENPPQEQPEVTSDESPAEFRQVQDEKIVPVQKPASGKSKKQRIIEMAKALNNNVSSDSSTTSGSRRRLRDREGNPVDELITEIQNSKEEITPENERQKQQIELINQFIRVQPSISNPKDRAPSAIGDLSTIKSGEFGDNIVSETLVEILVKQGKKDKAIEVLKKLIWKYPQKKAYFASQIEDLKK